jgi:hypothetical protein
MHINFLKTPFRLGHKKSQEQRLKGRFKFNFQTRNKTRLCDLKIKPQELRTRTQYVQKNVKMDLYYANICKHEHEKNMTRLWCKIVPKTNLEHTEGNEISYSYVYPFRDLVQRSFQKGFYVCIQ